MHGWVELADMLDEVDEGYGIDGHSVVWPGQIDHLANFQVRHRGLIGLRGGALWPVQLIL